MSKPVNPLEIQLNVRQNAQDLNAYLKDLQSWSSDVKTKDTALKSGSLTLTKTPVSSLPIRGVSAAVPLPSSASADDIRFEEEKKKDVVGPSNRSQAQLKLRRFHEAEADASAALEVDPRHIKSLWRRAQARKELRKFLGAIEDCEKVMAEDAKNAAAAAMLKELRNLFKKQQEAKAAASQPKVSSQPLPSVPVIPAQSSSASLTATTADAVPKRRMVIQEEEESEEEEEEIVKPILSSAATTNPASPTKNTPTPSTPATASTSAASTTVPSPASPVSASSPSAAAAASSASSSSPSSAAAAAAAASSSSSLRLPKTSYDFDSTFRTIRSSPPQIAAYLQLITDPKQFPALLKTALDGSFIKATVQAISQVIMPANDFRAALTILHGLTLVPRFNVARMMIDSKDKQTLSTVFQQIAAASASADTTPEFVRQIAKEFAITL